MDPATRSVVHICDVVSGKYAKRHYETAHPQCPHREDVVTSRRANFMAGVQSLTVEEAYPLAPSSACIAQPRQSGYLTIRIQIGDTFNRLIAHLSR